MERGLLFSVLLFCLGAFYSTNALAMPLGNIHITYWKNHHGQYTYFMVIKNTGPIAPEVTTPNSHTITNWQTFPPTQVPAGDKLLDDDENLVVFGLDTGRDDIIISNVLTLDTHSKFHGEEEPGVDDSDNDGTPNQTVAWHLPFDDSWGLNDTVKPGDWIAVMFTLSDEVKNFNSWVGGSDDAYIWNVQSTMLEDGFGIYDADNGLYLASILVRKIQAKKYYNF
ncbi:MAG: hypothetical protein GXP18_12695 [Gammaproteobacteria bacterium]|nr:hypothetical protein [Gammaproteobacteria bacterium]